MIPKKGSKVYINPKFLVEYDNLFRFDTNDIDDLIYECRNECLDVIDVKMRATGWEVSVKCKKLTGGFCVSLEPTGKIFDFETTTPFFINKKPAKPSYTYCSCEKPQVKHIYQSVNLHYDYCEKCRNEVKPKAQEN